MLDLPVHPAALKYRLLDGRDYEEFKEDIRLNGQEEPIALLGGLILDGRNRYRACRDLGVEPWFTNLPENTDPEQYVRTHNDLRRHLTPEEQEERRAEQIAREQEKAAAGMSLRAIAEEEGVSHEQVRRDLQREGVKHVTPAPPAKVTGKDGKQYPATKTPKPPPPPSHPYSDHMRAWMTRLAGETQILNVDYGGIGAMLAEPDKWDWREVREFLLPIMRELEREIRLLTEEIERHAT
jgi:pyruvate/2-oxoglutarate dehydrogenase complex dihydrolipoamide acyltransferase (E2) component